MTVRVQGRITALSECRMTGHWSGDSVDISVGLRLFLPTERTRGELRELGWSWALTASWLGWVYKNFISAALLTWRLNSLWFFFPDISYELRIKPLWLSNQMCTFVHMYTCNSNVGYLTKKFISPPWFWSLMVYYLSYNNPSALICCSYSRVWIIFETTIVLLLLLPVVFLKEDGHLRVENMQMKMQYLIVLPWVKKPAKCQIF